MTMAPGDVRGPLDFSGRRVLVTGGSSGIGLGIARRFLDQGASVDITGTRPSASDYEGLDGLRYHQLDVGDDAMVAASLPDADQLDVLVCNAGTIAYRRQEYRMETFRKVVDVNLHGVMAACTRFHDALARRRGSIVVVGSTSSYIATPGQPAYSASKGALRTLVKSLAHAWAGDGMRVNGMAPGFVETKLTAATRDNDAAYEATLQRIPMKRWGRCDEMGDVALFLASPMASYVTGQMLLVDGGVTLL